MLDFLKNISPSELVTLIVIVLILVVFFGSKTVTGLGKTSGETLKEIKKIKKSFTEVIEDDGSDKDKKEVSK
jgi:Sec-independent protein translocase protein TatA